MQTIPLVLALLLSLHGYRKKSLSPSGAITAFFVGYGSLSGGLWAFGVTLIGFYLIGSRATKYGKQRKAKLEDGYHEAGYRTGWQVLSNSATGLVCAVAWNRMFVGGGDCPVDGSIGSGWSRGLIFATIGHYGCCLGDTLASELGILSRSQPRLVTTLKPVPPGTNGGMSLEGTAASILGGVLAGVLMGVTLVTENLVCRDSLSNVLLSTILYGAFSGFFGSLIDSIMGATIQQTRYSAAKKVILHDGSKEEESQVISGFNVLTNNQVNLLSSMITSVVVGVMSLSL